MPESRPESTAPESGPTSLVQAPSWRRGFEKYPAGRPVQAMLISLPSQAQPGSKSRHEIGNGEGAKHVPVVVLHASAPRKPQVAPCMQSASLEHVPTPTVPLLAPDEPLAVLPLVADPAEADPADALPLPAEPEATPLDVAPLAAPLAEEPLEPDCACAPEVPAESPLAVAVPEAPWSPEDARLAACPEHEATETRRRAGTEAAKARRR